MDIEFLRPDGTPEPVPEEVLDTGPPRRPHRRLIVAVVLAGVALVVAGILASVSRGGGHHAPTAGHSSPPDQPRATLSFSTATVVPPNQQIAVDVPTGAPAVELNSTMITEVGGRLWWEALDGTLTIFTPVDDADGYQLVADPVADQVWLLLTGRHPEIFVASSTGPARQFSFDMPGLAAAAVLDGRLYATTATGVLAVTSSGHGYSTSSTSIRGGLDIAADPTRHRLLLIDLDGSHASVRAQGPADPSPQAHATLPFGKGTVLVADGQIWAAGYGDSGAVLARLDPRTLRVVANSPAAAELGPGAQVVGVGRQVLLVRSGGGGEGLWCVDARSGAVDESWPSAPGAVAVGPDGGYELSSTGQAPQLLTGGRCPG